MKADYMKQLDFYKPSLDTNNVLIIGTGHTGSYIAFALARMGVRYISVCDPDTVEQSNLPNQFFTENLPDNILKVMALKNTLKLIMPECEIKTYPKKAEELTQTEINEIYPTVIIIAIDSMAGRKRIYWSLIKNTRCKVIDARSGGEFASIFYFCSMINHEVEKYEQTLWDDKDVPDLPCTGKTVIDMSLVIAAQVARIYRKIITPEGFNQFHLSIDHKIGSMNCLEWLERS
jgi:molybdopterin/thiamine biosynthesis adenylyltransferase